jgi:glycosyltransferase involved in cell wall biosynthesis
VLLAIIQQCKASIVPLKDIPLFQGAIPSKIFEPMALGVPVLLGVKGEAYEMFCVVNKAAVFFEPENAKSLATVIDYFLENKDSMLDQINNGVCLIQQQFNRESIHNNLLQAIDSR